MIPEHIPVQKVWGRLLTCGPIGNRPAWRLPTATQLTKLSDTDTELAQAVST